MFSNYLSSIEDVSIYAIITLILFFGVFVGVLVWIFTAKKSYIKKMKNLPLEETNEQEEIKNENTHEN